MGTLTDYEKVRTKETALKMSRELNPNTVVSQHQGSLGYTSSIGVPPTTEKILKTAKDIYDWLVE